MLVMTESALLVTPTRPRCRRARASSRLQGGSKRSFASGCRRTLNRAAPRKRPSRVEIGVVHHRHERSLRSGGRVDPPVGLLVHLKPGERPDPWERRLQRREDGGDPGGLVATQLGARGLGDDDGLVFRRQPRIDAPHDRREGLPGGGGLFCFFVVVFVFFPVVVAVFWVVV